MGSLSAKARVGWGPPAEAHGYPFTEAQAGAKCRREALRRRWNEGRMGNLTLHLRHLLLCPEGIDDILHIRHRRRRVSLREDDAPGFIDDDIGTP